MMQDHPDDVFISPPDEQDDWEDEPTPPGWPRVVGTISIVIGSLNFVCSGAGAAMSMFYARLMSSAAGEMEGGVPPVLVNPDPLLYVLTAIGLVWAVFLIVAGSVTAMRKPVGRVLHLVWAVVAIGLAAWGMSLQLGMQAEIAEWINQNPDSDFARASQAPGSQIGTIIGLLVGAILGFAWPAFCLLWFGLFKRKAEDMTGGVEEQGI